MEGLLLAYNEKSNKFVTVGEISEIYKCEIVSEKEINDSQETRRLIDSISGSFTCDCKISGYAWRTITGSDSNNDRRRHHVPMRRRRKIVYICGVSLGKWRAKKILNTLRRRGNA